MPEITTQIRIGVFETNSSSTHSICVCTREAYEAFKLGNLVLDGNQLVDPATLRYPGETYEDYNDNEYEHIFQSHTTPRGEELVVFGYYGYNG